MTLLADVLDPAELTAAVENGLVRVQRHPTRPLTTPSRMRRASIRTPRWS
jgi:hypothetical protein